MTGFAAPSNVLRGARVAKCCDAGSDNVRWCGEVLPSHDLSFDPALNLAFVAPSVVVASLPETLAHAVAAGDEVRFDVEEVVELSAQEILEGSLMLPSIDDTTASSERVGRRCVAVRVRFEGGGVVLVIVCR